MRQLTNEEITMILGALRLFQESRQSAMDPDWCANSEHFEHFRPLQDAALEALCEELTGDDTYVMTLEEANAMNHIYPSATVVVDDDGDKRLKCPHCGELDNFQDYEDVLSYRDTCLSSDGATLYVEGSSSYADDADNDRLNCQNCNKDCDYPADVEVSYIEGDVYAAAVEDKEA